METLAPGTLVKNTITEEIGYITGGGQYNTVTGPLVEVLWDDRVPAVTLVNPNVLKVVEDDG